VSGSPKRCFVRDSQGVYGIILKYILPNVARAAVAAANRTRNLNTYFIINLLQVGLFEDYSPLKPMMQQESLLIMSLSEEPSFMIHLNF